MSFTQPRKCNNCGEEIKFDQDLNTKKWFPVNLDGTLHKCKAPPQQQQEESHIGVARRIPGSQRLL